MPFYRRVSEIGKQVWRKLDDFGLFVMLLVKVLLCKSPGVGAEFKCLVRNGSESFSLA